MTKKQYQKECSYLSSLNNLGLDRKTLKLKNEWIKEHNLRKKREKELKKISVHHNPLGKYRPYDFPKE